MNWIGEIQELGSTKQEGKVQFILDDYFLSMERLILRENRRKWTEEKQRTGVKSPSSSASISGSYWKGAAILDTNLSTNLNLFDASSSQGDG